MARTQPARSLTTIQKCPTGIHGLDEITFGGLPRGRPTLVCGGPGCGKTLFAVEFLVRGILDYDEPGAFIGFEEAIDDLSANVASLQFDLPALVRKKKLALDYVHIDRTEIIETGEYDLDGLFIRLDEMIRRVGAKRVALDTLESLFGDLPNPGILRAELRRLFRWLRDRHVTAVVTAERGEGAFSRHGLEEYVSDCVILLDNRVRNQVATRRLRIVKYRGSGHESNEYPTMIDRRGLSVLPITSLGLDYPTSSERISTGVADLDAMLEGRGYFKGSSILLSGTAGTGKSSLAAAFGNGVCAAGGKCFCLSFEESPGQLIRNMASIGMDLNRWVESGLWKFRSIRPTMQGLESHIVDLFRHVEEFEPDAVIIDPVTNLTSMGDFNETRAMLTRVIDHLKGRGITTVFTSLTPGSREFEQTDVGVSSLMDTWLLLRVVEEHDIRSRSVCVLKSRGMAHSNRVHEMLLSNEGIHVRAAGTNHRRNVAGDRLMVAEAPVARVMAPKRVTARSEFGSRRPAGRPIVRTLGRVGEGRRQGNGARARGDGRAESVARAKAAARPAANKPGPTLARARRRKAIER